MSAECSNRPLDVRAINELRAHLIDGLSTYSGVKVREVIEPVQPIGAYALLFAESPNIGIQRRVSRAYSEALSRLPERGWVYVFRDVRDGDIRIVKIGSTVGPVRRRISQWRRELGAQRDELSALFSVETRDVRLAETVVHRLLFCQWLPKRINLETGRRLVEYFSVAQLPQLRLLVAAVARHVDWYALRTLDSRRLGQATMGSLEY